MNPLLERCSGDASRRPVCTTRIAGRLCGKPAEWRCHRHGHDAVCRACLEKQQNDLLGGPRGPGKPHKRCTDIYDAFFQGEKERKDCTVYFLDGLTSRNPPNFDVDWNTTYRLETAALVGIVRLTVSGEPLTRQSVLQWGEIVSTYTGPDAKRCAESVGRWRLATISFA
jgi:hypothetical protein